jgi:hypothetical protein
MGDKVERVIDGSQNIMSHLVDLMCIIVEKYSTFPC